VSTLELVPTDRLAQKCSSEGRYSPARRVRSCARGQSDTSYSARHLRGDASFHVTIVLGEVTREAADAILAGERPANVRVADDYPTEFSAGMAQPVGTEGQFHYFVHRLEDDVVGEIGAVFVDEDC
jgi:hypothetical protein